MEGNKIDIYLGTDPKKTKVIVNDVEIKYIRSIQFSASQDDVTFVKLEFFPSEIKVKGSLEDSIKIV